MYRVMALYILLRGQGLREMSEVTSSTDFVCAISHELLLRIKKYFVHMSNARQHARFQSPHYMVTFIGGGQRSHIQNWCMLGSKRTCLLIDQYIYCSGVSIKLCIKFFIFIVTEAHFEKYFYLLILNFPR